MYGAIAIARMCTFQKEACSGRTRLEHSRPVRMSDGGSVLKIWTRGRISMGQVMTTTPKTPSSGWPACNGQWLLANSLPRPYMAMTLLRSAVSRQAPASAEQAIVSIRKCATVWRNAGGFPSECAVDMRVVWVPHMLNQLDPAMMQDSTAASIQLIRKGEANPEHAHSTTLGGLGVQAPGSVPGAGLVIHPGRVVGHDLSGGYLKLDVEHRGALEDGDKICSPHGTKHVIRVMQKSRMPIIGTTGEVADLCISPSGILSRQSLGLILAGCQAIADGIDKVPLREPPILSPSSSAPRCSTSSLR